MIFSLHYLGAPAVCLVVHVIGDISGALGFPGSRLYARFKVVCNTQHWHVMQGAEEGYTQVDEASVSRTLIIRKQSDHAGKKVRVSSNDWKKGTRLEGLILSSSF